MSARPFKLTRKLATPVSAVAVWVLVVQLATFCCEPVAAAPVQPAGEAHCHHDKESQPASSGHQADTACCMDGVSVCTTHAVVESSAKPLADPGDPAVPPSVADRAGYHSPPQRVGRVAQAPGCSRPYYLSYCVFLE